MTWPLTQQIIFLLRIIMAVSGVQRIMALPGKIWRIPSVVLFHRGWELIRMITCFVVLETGRYIAVLNQLFLTLLPDKHFNLTGPVILLLQPSILIRANHHPELLWKLGYIQQARPAAGIRLFLRITPVIAGQSCSRMAVGTFLMETILRIPVLMLI